VTQIVLAFPGTAVRKSGIRQTLASRGEIKDIDKILCGLPSTRERLVAAGAYQFQNLDKTPRLINVMQHLPRTDVLELWAAALREAAAGLGTSEHTLRVLLSGIMYHSNRRSEFYSPVDLSRLIAELRERSLTVGRVAMFIDDLHDIYARLSKEDEIYERLKSVEAEYGRLEDEDRINPRQLAQHEQVLIATEVQVSQLITLLHWRQMEVTQAERIAASLGVPYLLWSMKQDVAALAHWLTGTARSVVYVSHPISRPRRERTDGGPWPDFVTECNAVQGQLAELGTTAIMPAAIDEYRLRKQPSEGPTRPRRRPELTERWPPIPGESLYTHDTDGAPDHAGMLAPMMLQGEALAPAPGGWGSIDVLHDPLRALERQIGVQVAARDHTLVVHSGHIVVFRPFYQEPRISGGVRAEIEHWSTLAQRENARRIVFLHRLADVRPAIQRPDLQEVLLGAREELVSEMLRVDRQVARRIIQDTRGQTWDLLDAGAKTPSEQRREDAVVDEATALTPRRALWKILGNYNVEIQGVPQDQVGVWVISDESHWQSVWPAILDFLDGGSVPDDAYSTALALVPPLSD